MFAVSCRSAGGKGEVEGLEGWSWTADKGSQGRPPAALTHDLEVAVAPLPIAEKHDENAWHFFCASEPSMSSSSEYRPS
jgi:hypothetical protein